MIKNNEDQQSSTINDVALARNILSSRYVAKPVRITLIIYIISNLHQYIRVGMCTTESMCKIKTNIAFLECRTQNIKVSHCNDG